MSDLQDRYNELCGEVIVTYDENIKKEYEEKMKDKEYLKQLEITKKEYYLDLKEEDKNSNKSYDIMGQNSEINKLNRMKIFQKGYDEGEFVTLSAAVEYMKRKVANGLSYKTCKKYAEDLGLYILDDKNNNWILGKKPQWLHE